jgi:hypothetical protein
MVRDHRARRSTASFSHRSRAARRRRGSISRMITEIERRRALQTYNRSE